MYQQPMMETCESTCDRVIKLDPKIRFAVVITDNGKPIVSRTRRGLVPIIDRNDGEVMLTEAALITRMHREFDGKLGKVNYVIIKREKIAVLIFSLGKELLYVSCDLGSNLCKLGEKILSKVN